MPDKRRLIARHAVFVMCILSGGAVSWMFFMLGFGLMRLSAYYYGAHFILANLWGLGWGALCAAVAASWMLNKLEKTRRIGFGVLAGLAAGVVTGMVNDMIIFRSFPVTGPVIGAVAGAVGGSLFALLYDVLAGNEKSAGPDK